MLGLSCSVKDKERTREEELTRNHSRQGLATQGALGRQSWEVTAGRGAGAPSAAPGEHGSGCRVQQMTADEKRCGEVLHPLIRRAGRTHGLFNVGCERKSRKRQLQIVGVNK